jgi:hypothetical protein
MRVSTVTLFSALTGVALAAPYSPFPLSDGFPSPNADQLKSISQAAGGYLPNGALPTKLSDTATVTLQLIALNEIFEVAYFTDLVQNITNGVSGYEVGDNKAFALKALTAIKNVRCLLLTYRCRYLLTWSLVIFSKKSSMPSAPMLS